MTACYSGPLWHACFVEPRAELDVARDIDQDLGFDWCIPFERVTKNGRAISRPMLPRYVLVGVDHARQDWQLLLDVQGVVDVVRASNNVPGYIPAAAIWAMRKAELLGEYDETTKMPAGFEIGERVGITDGPFAGHRAMIEEFIAKIRSTTAKKRARVVVDFMGRMSSIELPVTSLEKL